MSKFVSDNQVYQGYKDFIASSDGAITKLTQVKTNLSKKIEAKKIELQQDLDVIESNEKQNKEIQRFLDIYNGRNNTL